MGGCGWVWQPPFPGGRIPVEPLLTLLPMKHKSVAEKRALLGFFDPFEFPFKTTKKGYPQKKASHPCLLLNSLCCQDLRVHLLHGQFHWGFAMSGGRNFRQATNKMRTMNQPAIKNRVIDPLEKPWNRNAIGRSQHQLWPGKISRPVFASTFQGKPFCGFQLFLTTTATCVLPCCATSVRNTAELRAQGGVRAWGSAQASAISVAPGFTVTGIRMHCTPEHCNLYMVVPPYFGVEKAPCFKWLQNVSFPEPCVGRECKDQWTHAVGTGEMR